MLSILMALAAAASEPASPPVSSLTLQQRFDKAIELAQSGDCINAVAMFEELKPERAFRPETLGGSMVLVHQGNCLVSIGLIDTGERYIEQGLPTLRKAGAQFGIDIATALISLGDAAMTRWDYAQAKARYLEAMTIQDGADPFLINLRLAKATAFEGGPEPLRYAEEAIRLGKAAPESSKRLLAGLHRVHARILMNQGQEKEAYKELKTALDLSGGLDLTVDISEIGLRSDLAVAAQLSGDDAAARKYLAYTGAGRLKDKNLDSGLFMEPPVCGSETGLRPEDLAVVDFAVGDSGRVIRAETAYTRGSPQVAAQFARAVSSWVWDPEMIKTTPQLFRASTYVELRCTTQGQAVPGPMTLLDKRFTAWAAETAGIDMAAFETARQGDKNLLAQLRSLEAQGDMTSDSLKKTALLGLLNQFQLTSVIQLDQQLTAALAAAQGAGAPPEVINWLRIRRAHYRISYSQWISELPATKMADLLTMLNDPTISGDPLAANTIRLLAASERPDRQRTGPRLDLLNHVAADERLPQHHPLRQLANLSLANEAAQRKAFVEADRFFKATGLTEEQCALIGPKPAMQHLGLRNSAYPIDALVNNFEGWLRLEFDISADGRPDQVRPIIAYPPFIFNKASIDGVRASRFEASYRPEGGSACVASRQGIGFRIPE